MSGAAIRGRVAEKGTTLSFVTTAPELVAAAAHDLAGIGSSLADVTASVAGQTELDVFRVQYIEGIPGNDGLAQGKQRFHGNSFE